MTSRKWFQMTILNRRTVSSSQYCLASPTYSHLDNEWMIRNTLEIHCEKCSLTTNCVGEQPQQKYLLPE